LGPEFPGSFPAASEAGKLRLPFAMASAMVSPASRRDTGCSSGCPRAAPNLRASSPRSILVRAFVAAFV
jgi:hypothetical protein